MNYRHRIIAASIPAAMYLTSLITPVLDPFTRYPSPQTGADAFRVGWKAMFIEEWDGPRFDEWIALVAAWWANPIIWATLVSFVFGWRTTAIVLAGVGACLAMWVLPYYWGAFIGYPGYWLWWGSAIVVLLMATFLVPRRPTPLAEDYGPLTEPDSPPFAESFEEAAEPPFAEPLTPDVP